MVQFTLTDKTQRPKLVNGLAQVHTPEPKILVAKGSERVLIIFKDSLAGCWLIKTFIRKVLRSLFFSFYAKEMEICLFVQCKKVKMWKRLNCMESNFAAKGKYIEKNDKRNKWRETETETFFSSWSSAEISLRETQLWKVDQMHRPENMLPTT